MGANKLRTLGERVLWGSVCVAVLMIPTPPSIAQSCTADCDRQGMVTIDEILTMVNIALGLVEGSACTAGDANDDSRITIDEILTGVNNALSGCPSQPTFTPTDAPTATATQTMTETPTATNTPTATSIDAPAALWFAGSTRNDPTPNYYHTDESTDIERETVRLPSSGRLLNMYVLCERNQTIGSQVFTLCDRSVGDGTCASRDTGLTPVTCAVSAGSATCADVYGSTGHYYDYADGALLTLQSVATNGAAGGVCHTEVRVIASGGGSDDHATIYSWNGGLIGSDPVDGNFCAPSRSNTDLANCHVGTAERAVFITPAAGTLAGLGLRLHAELGNGHSEKYTICNTSVGNGSCNSTANGLTDLVVQLASNSDCTGAGTPFPCCTDSGSGTCQSQSDIATTCATNCSVNAGDRLTLKYNQSGGVQARIRHFAIEINGPKSVIANTEGPLWNTARISHWHEGVVGVNSIGYRANRSGVLRNLFAYLNANLGGLNEELVLTARKGSTAPPSNTTLACIIRSGSATCANRADTVTVSEGDYIDISVTGTGDNTGTQELSYALEMAAP
jgi:hypothetical protein